VLTNNRKCGAFAISVYDSWVFFFFL